MTSYGIVAGQTIKVLPMKEKNFNLNREIAYCNIKNISSTKAYYRIGLEVLKNDKVILAKDDVFDLLSVKEEKVTKFAHIMPGQTVMRDLGSGALRKESYWGIKDMIKDNDLQDYEYRFKVVYGQNSKSVNKVTYSQIFKLSKK